MNQTTAINGFFEKVGADESLKDQFEKAASPDEIVALAKTQSYEFSSEELREFATLAKQQESGELTTDQLEQVAGGGPLTTSVAIGGALVLGRRFGWW